MCETASEKGDEMVQETIDQAVENVKALDFATLEEVTEAFHR
ncbi:hypothetical protein SVXHr_2309 [Halorhabdus sp. SVX81]|nr:hypothetical protein [Halorhabdus sp. SVX81]WEL18462.1 hypothetical protein SVXHr_2309 [Halorhabdus sp. SVX81]